MCIRISYRNLVLNYKVNLRINYINPACFPYNASIDLPNLVLLNFPGPRGLVSVHISSTLLHGRLYANLLVN